jgi:AsmA protein
MNRAIKWGLIISGSLVVLLIAALVLLPRFVDVRRYKPLIEEQVTKATGRPFSVGDDLHISLFPYAGISFSDLHLGNPPGFEEKDFVFVKSFVVRVKLLPLLFRDVQVKRFILNGARIVLETNKDGRINWKFNPKSGNGSSEKTSPNAKIPENSESGKWIDLKAFALGELAVKDGSVVWMDDRKKLRREISDMTLLLQNVSLERPVGLTFSAKVDGQPLSVDGDVGPIGKMPGKGMIPLNLSVSAFEQMDVNIKGHVKDPATRPEFDMDVKISPFSPRKLMTAMGKTFPVSTADPEAIGRIAFNGEVKGDMKNISISKGVLDLDESKAKLMIQADTSDHPRVTFNLAVDQIDMDRYLSAQGAKESVQKTNGSGASKVIKSEPINAKSEIDYSPLRRLTLHGTVRIEKLKIKDAKIENVYLKVAGEKGLFNFRPVNLELYQGKMSGKGMFSVRQNVPRTDIQLELNGVNAGPLLVDVLKKDFLEGVLKAKIHLGMKGDDPVVIKKTLTGNGDLIFINGAVKGINLEAMIQNVKTAFGLAEKGENAPRTDFSELHIPFSVQNGVFRTTATTLVSPLVRLKASGVADLVKERLDFRLEPKVVATLKGQGDIENRSGIMVPVLVSGTFSSPEFRPDLQGVLKKEIEKRLPDLQKQFKGNESSKEGSQTIEDQVKGILKLFGK